MTTFLGWVSRLARTRLIRRCAVVAVVLAYPWWYCMAYPRGVAVARIDQSRGRYVVLSAGFPAPWSGEMAELLRVRYGVEVRTVARCVIAPDVGWYMDGYNGVSMRLIIQRFGKDVIAECEADAMARWKADQQSKGLDTDEP